MGVVLSAVVTPDQKSACLERGPTPNIPSPPLHPPPPYSELFEGGGGGTPFLFARRSPVSYTHTSRQDNATLRLHNVGVELLHHASCIEII